MIDASVLAAVAAVVAVAGGVAAATARDGRIVVLGLMIAAVAASPVAAPMPTSLAITARILGALLAAYLLWMAVGSGAVGSAGSAIGMVAEVAVAATAFLAGLVVRPVDPLSGPVAAQAAGFSLVVLAVVPLAGRDVFRVGIGVLLLTLGGGLLLGAWSGSPPDLEQLALAALIVGIAGATSLLLPTAEGLAAAAEADRMAVGWDLVPGPEKPLVPEAPAAPERPHPEPSQRPIPQRPAGPAAPPESPAGPAAAPDVAVPHPRPMTADPIEPDDWLAWSRPEPEPRRRGPRKPPSGPASRRSNPGGRP